MAKQKLISIGERGTAFVSLSDKAASTFKLNEENVNLAKIHLTDEQFEAYKAGKNSGVLWYDSCSWLAKRDEKFWIGTLDKALELGLVRKAILKVKNGGKSQQLTAYVRAAWHVGAEKNDHSIAVERGGVNGRIETRQINDKRNALYVRHVQAVELV